MNFSYNYGTHFFEKSYLQSDLNSKLYSPNRNCPAFSNNYTSVLQPLNTNSTERKLTLDISDDTTHYLKIKDKVEKKKLPLNVEFLIETHFLIRKKTINIFVTTGLLTLRVLWVFRRNPHQIH